MSYVFEDFSSEGGASFLYPPELEISIMIGLGKLSEQTCDELSQFILSQEQNILSSYEPVSVGGMQDGLSTRWTSYNLLTFEHEALAPLKEVIKEAYLAYTTHNNIPRFKNVIQCWANVLRSGDKLQPHEHEFSRRCLSATISLSQTETSTIYHFPFKLKNGARYTNTVRVPTLKGAITLFPGWLTHFTSPVPQGVTRVTLGLNIIDGSESGILLDFDTGTSFDL